jgi:hypothetical protein
MPVLVRRLTILLEHIGTSEAREVLKAIQAN